ncbi:hypothetical protein SDC9_162678 [bioreactor metagenome]|uniref:Uncharacterized protein n=1 Tax=bioreactor metagenome TaxID=1076179 RepID=A0A645FLQ5_9ZZZZ
MQVDEALFRRRTQAVGNRIDDAAVRLVGNDALDLRDIEIAPGQCLLCCGHHRLHGIFEDFLAFHPEIMEPVADRLRGGGAAAPSSWHVQQVAFLSISSHDSGEQTVGIRTVPENRCSCSIAEQNTGVSILPVDDGSELLRSDHQDGIVRPGHDELLGDFQAVNKPGASSLKVERCGSERAKFPLNQACGRREGHVWSDGCDDNQVNLIGRDSRVGHRLLGGLGREV